MSSPWSHQMSPQFGDVSEDPVAALEGHWAGSLAATCNSALQALTYLLTGMQRALGAVSSEGQEAWDTWTGVPPHRSPATKDKEPACAAWALGCSPSWPGTSETHLQLPEPLMGWPSGQWHPGNRSHGEEELHGGQLTLQLSTRCLFAKSSYRMWILFGIGFWLWSHIVSQLHIRSPVNLKVTQRKNSQVPPAKSYLILIKHFKCLSYLFNPRQYS